MDPVDITISVLGAAGISALSIVLYLFALCEIKRMRERVAELERENTALAYTRFREMIHE